MMQNLQNKRPLPKQKSYSKSSKRRPSKKKLTVKKAPPQIRKLTTLKLSKPAIKQTSLRRKSVEDHWGLLK